MHATTSTDAIRPPARRASAVIAFSVAVASACSNPSSMAHDAAVGIDTAIDSVDAVDRATADIVDIDTFVPPPVIALDRYGGAMRLPIANGTGYFTVANAYGRDWLVTPDGHAFVSMGVNHVDPGGDTDQMTNRSPYGDWVSANFTSDSAWSDSVLTRLTGWTFNTIGAWSRHDLFTARMPQTPILSFADPGWGLGSGPDVFDPAWVASSMSSAVTQIGARATDPYIIGWFLDNELRWGPDWRSFDDLFDDFLARPATAPGKGELVAFVRSWFNGDIAAFNSAFATALPSFDALATTTSVAATAADAGAASDVRHAWSGHVADQYFRVASTAVRAADPNHLVLGCRFVSWLAPQSVVDAAGHYLDVVSVNHYEISTLGQNFIEHLPELSFRTSTANWLQEFATRTNRPLLISEFGARAADSGLPNTYPPPIVQVVWQTQSDRADALERYGRAMANAPYIVGIHWFEWVDEPPGGRTGDGENSNWGLVNLMDAPYATVVARAPLVGPMLTYSLIP